MAAAQRSPCQLDQNVLGHFDAECSQLSFYNRREAVRNTALCDLAGGDNGCCFQRKRADFQNRRAARRLLGLPQFLLLDHEWDDARAAQFVARMDDAVAASWRS